MTGSIGSAGKSQEEVQASIDSGKASQDLGTSLHGGPIYDQDKVDMTKMIRDQALEKMDYIPDDTTQLDLNKFGETVIPEALPKGHPDRIEKETEETIKQLSTKEGTKEALKEFKALKTGRQYVPDLDLLEKLGIKKPEGILGSLIDTGQKYFDPKKMAFNVAKNYGMKKLGLGALNPYLGLLSLFGFNPFKSLTNKFAKKPDMSAFNKLGLQTDRFPTQTMDTRTARVPKTTAQKIESGEIDLNKLITGKSDISPEFQHLVKQAKVSKQDLSRYATQKDLIDKQKYQDALDTTLFGSEITPYEFEQMKKGKITKPGTYKKTPEGPELVSVRGGGLIDRPLMGRSRDI
jgi:hypothetical protein